MLSVRLALALCALVKQAARGRRLYCFLVPAMLRVVLVASCFGLDVMGQGPDAALTREQLRPLTQFRQQHRKTIDGRLCAAAFVQDRKAFTDCSTSPNPTGESGRPWCYVESQVREHGSRCRVRLRVCVCVCVCVCVWGRWSMLVAVRHLGAFAVCCLVVWWSLWL